MMNRFVKFSLAIFIFSFANNLSAQMNVELVNSGQILYDADMYYSQGKYTKAENLYLKVGRNDTNYAAVLRDLAYTYIEDKEDSLALQTARRAKELNSDYQPDFYNVIGLALKDLEKYDTAIATFNEGIRLYPYKYILQYQKGMCYFKMKKYPEAQVCFEKAIELNPYHASSHFQLGKTCAEQGRIVPAILSYQYFLMLENNTERAAKVVTVLEDLYAGDSQSDPDMELSSKEANDGCFDDIKDMIASQIYLQPNYKNKTIIKLKMVKGLQALLEKLHYENNTDNWWMENYVPFYVELQEKQYLAPFASHILFGVRDNPSVAKSVKKNKKKIVVFATWASGYIKDNCKHPALSLIEASLGKKEVTFYDNRVIAGVGPTNPAGLENGEWFYFYMQTGHLLSRGSYVNGKRDGEWNWFFDDGSPREKTVFANGMKEGASQQWFENGVTSFKCTYHNDLVDGEYSVYAITGQLTETATMKTGKLEGIATAFYEDGTKKADINYLAGKLDGDIVFYTIDGKEYKKVDHKNDLKNGHATEHYITGVLKSEGDYKAGGEIGHWKIYWDNGKVYREGDYKDGGLKNGIWNEYYRDGTLSVKEKYVSGKLTGVTEYYDTDGKLYSEKTYAADKLKSENFIDKDGKVIAEYAIKDGYEVTEFYANGQHSAKGTFYGGVRSGDWKIYSENGGWLFSKEHYYNGDLSGNRIEYYRSGEESNELEYHSNQRDGYLKSYFQNGTLEEEGWYVNDQRQGDWYEYNQRGIVIAHRYYLNDALHGYQEFYDEKGKIDEEDFFKEENLWSRARFDSTGVALYKSDFTNGSGVYDLKFNNGQSCLHQEYKNGVLNGSTIRHEYSGTKTIDAHFIDGQQHGKRLEYFSDSGKISLDADFSYNQKHGKSIAYWDNGAVRYEENYYNGDLDGDQKYYYDNGKLMREGTYDLGKLNGELKMYSDDGLLECIRYYNNGDLLGYSYLDKDGKVKPMIAFEDASGKFTAYYQNGNKSFEGEYANGRFNGNVIEYFSDGKVSEDENYKYGDYEGMQKYYYHNGNLKKSQNYVGDELDGTATYNYESGKVKAIEVYFLGDNFGTWIEYNEDGVITKKQVWYDDFQYAETITPPFQSTGTDKPKTPKPKTK